MLIAAGATYWLLTSEEFKPIGPQVSGDLRYTDQAALIGSALSAGGYGDRNVFWLRTTEIQNALLANPAIADAHVAVGLPNELAISVTEKTPVFALEHAGHTNLVDAGGVVLAQVDASVPASLGLPSIDDARSTTSELPAVGQTIDPIELAAILQLGAVTPALVDSHAASLAISVRDDDGFVMTAAPQGWQAIFGQYTPNLRPTDLIPRQVQCLRSLIGADEAHVTTVYLAPLDQNCGTYVPDATPHAPAPAPSQSR